MMKLKLIPIGLLTAVCLWTVSCGTGDSPIPQSTVDFSSVLLQTFPLSEVDLSASDISIQQPVLVDGIPQNKGAIRIEIESTDIAKFSLRQVEFSSSEFSISPAVGEKLITPGEAITYTITSSKDVSVSLQYDVLVVAKEANSTVDFTLALLQTFPLSEVDIDISADKITIQQPELINGIPQGKGEITIELQHTDIEKFSLKQVDFNTSDFAISPAVGEKEIVPGETITYTITSHTDANGSLRYDVLVIVKDVNPALQELRMNEISFLKANNPSLSQDITSLEVREHFSQNYSGTVMIIVPDGTDFSDLIPTLDYEGRSIQYTTSHYGNRQDEFSDYTEGAAVDFKFPNVVAFRIYNSDGSRYREYRVLVDVENPITFDAETVTLNNGNYVSYYQIYDSVIGFAYSGNYPMEFNLIYPQVAVTYTPEANAVNYYLNIYLQEDNPADEDDILTNGEKGKLFIGVNFPGSFKGSAIGFDNYVIEATFNPRLHTGGTPGVRDFGGLSDLDFMIYNPVKIEIVANVFVTN